MILLKQITRRQVYPKHLPPGLFMLCCLCLAHKNSIQCLCRFGLAIEPDAVQFSAAAALLVDIGIADFYDAIFMGDPDALHGYSIHYNDPERRPMGIVR